MKGTNATVRISWSRRGKRERELAASPQPGWPALFCYT